jgi:hypothetical protein
MVMAVGFEHSPRSRVMSNEKSKRDTHILRFIIIVIVVLGGGWHGLS